MFNHNQENREWLLQALCHLENFVAHDEDYYGDRVYESKAIAYQKHVIQEGKYRVVFLGAFNVGKSTAINAFLGGAYLPVDIEECTARLTFIQRGDGLRLLLHLDTPASENEIEALARSVADIEPAVEVSEDARAIIIMCPDQRPAHMRSVMELLSTVSADETSPHLAPLREKIDSLTLFLPSEILLDDITFIDTPGVHSISEARQRITYDVIEHCHLVIVFVDSAFVGNIHDLNLIKRIITCRGRRVFFVLNKADKLENEEIDPKGIVGPAAQLIEAFRRNGIPENFDVFFLSAHRALRAVELENGQVTLEEVLADNKLLIPQPVIERVMRSEIPTRDLAAYLMGQSRLSHLKERLLDYLINENKGNRVLNLATLFVYERAADYLIGIRNTLKLARDPSKFEELRAGREALLNQIQSIKENTAAIMAEYSLNFRGGGVGTITRPGYVARLHSLLTEAAIESQVVAPVLGWLREPGRLKEVRQNKFRPLAAYLEHQVDLFVSGILDSLHEMIEEVEASTAEAIAAQIGRVRELRASLTEPEKKFEAHVEGSVSGEYVAFGTGGAVVGAMAGAAVGSVVPVIGTAIGVGLGGLLGVVLGFLARLAWSEERWIKKLAPVVRKNAMEMLLEGKEDGTQPISMLLADYLRRRGTAFESAVNAEVENALDAVQKECYLLLAREEEIRRERDAIIARLEPKEIVLEGIRTRAESLLEEQDLSYTPVVGGLS